MSELKTTSLSHKDNNTGTPNITMYPDGTTSLPGTVLGGFRNQIINSTLSVFQRSANAGGTGYRSADRWRLGGTAPNLQIVYPNISGLPAGSAGRLTAQAGGGTITQAIELHVSGRAAPFLPGTEWTLSFYTTHPSLVASDISVRFADASNSTANITEFTQGTLTSIESFSSGWVRYAVTYTAPSGVAGSNKCVNVRLSGLSDGSAVDFTGIQFEPGPVATPLEIRPISVELSMAQRYFFTVRGDIFTKFGSIFTNNGGGSWMMVSLPVSMRTSPDVTFNNIATGRSGTNLSQDDIETINFGGTHISLDLDSSYAIPADSSDIVQLRETIGTFNLDAEL